MAQSRGQEHCAIKVLRDKGRNNARTSTIRQALIGHCQENAVNYRGANLIQSLWGVPHRLIFNLGMSRFRGDCEQAELSEQDAGTTCLILQAQW